MMTRLIVSLILIITSTPLLAATWYQVNIVVFENRSAVSGDEILTQPEGVQFVAPENAVDIDAIEESGDAQGFQRTTIIDQEFNNVVGSLKRSSGYKVLLVKSWRQPGLERESAIPVLIRGGDSFGNHSRVEGTVRLVLSRYLHLEADLWLGDYVQQMQMPDEWSDAANINAAAGTRPLPVAGDVNSIAPIDTYEPTRLFHLQESRRMRSKELHYIDHPMLGVVVKVIPLQDTPTPADTAANPTDDTE